MIEPRFADVRHFLQRLSQKKNQLQGLLAWLLDAGAQRDARAQLEEAEYMSDLFIADVPIARILGEPQMQWVPQQALGDDMQSEQEAPIAPSEFGYDMQSEQGTSNFEFSVNNDVDAMPMPPSSVSVAPQRRENLGPRRNNYNGPPEDDEKHGAPNL
jgi:hypothetical protein